MLDTDIPLNDPADRPITGVLYGGGREMRLRQEIVLGIGGVRALRALGIYPAVWHMNEGHVGLPRPGAGARAGAPRGRASTDALEAVRAQPVFTTHTPVPAGNEAFDRDLVTQLPRAAGRRTWAATAEAALEPRRADGRRPST